MDKLSSRIEVLQLSYLLDSCLIIATSSYFFSECSVPIPGGEDVGGCHGNICNNMATQYDIYNSGLSQNW